MTTQTKDKTMQLTYRGVSYNYDEPAHESVDPLASGKYHGLDIRFRNMKKAPEYAPTLGLKYHGFSPNKSGETSTSTQESSGALTISSSANTNNNSVDNLARTLMLKRTCSVKRRQQDMLSRSVFEAGVPAEEVERDWSKIQGMLHPTFRSAYGRSGAAMS